MITHIITRVPAHTITIREDFLAICTDEKGKPDFCAAKVLDIMERMQVARINTVLQSMHLNDRIAKKHPEAKELELVKAVMRQHEQLWVSLSNKQTQEWLLGEYSENIVSRSFKLLLEKEFLSRRENPYDKSDSTPQWLLQIDKVMGAINAWYKGVRKSEEGGPQIYGGGSALLRGGVLRSEEGQNLKNRLQDAVRTPPQIYGPQNSPHTSISFNKEKESGEKSKRQTKADRDAQRRKELTEYAATLPAPGALQAAWRLWVDHNLEQDTLPTKQKIGIDHRSLTHWLNEGRDVLAIVENSISGNTIRLYGSDDRFKPAAPAQPAPGEPASVGVELVAGQDYVSGSRVVRIQSVGDSFVECVDDTGKSFSVPIKTAKAKLRPMGVTA